MIRNSFRIFCSFFVREPDFCVGGRENPYLMRWWIIPRNPLFNIYLHKFLRDDDDRALHDHPWPSLSIVLCGAYLEHMPASQKEWPYNRYQIVRRRRAGQIIFRKPRHAHRIELLKKTYKFADCPVPGDIAVMQQAIPAWTLFITGPRMREWGFHCERGWRHWKDFTAPGDSSRVGPGCD